MKISRLFVLAVLIAVPAFAETPIVPEVNPPGDIPDSQAFITFTSPYGFSLKVPEGWARKDVGMATSFSDKYNHIAITYMSSAVALDEAAAKSTLVPEIQKAGRAVADVAVKPVKLTGGTAFLITYSSNSEPNAVTNKQIREENESVYFVNGNRGLTLTLSAPKGADNVDQWNLIINSFRWK